MNRELSRLDFDSRVLSMAQDRGRPLADRIRFLAILSDSLDDFFQVRVAGLDEQLMVPLTLTSPDGMTPEQELMQRATLGLVETGGVKAE